MKIGLIGKGTVGTAIYRGLEELGHTMSFFDVKYPETKIQDVLSSDCVFICVPTDQQVNGDCDTTIVESVIAELAQQQYQGLVAIKSTVIPGTTDRLSSKYSTLKICNVPEFLRAKFAYEDFIEQDVLVVGSQRPEDYELITEIHGPYPCEVSCVTAVEAEIIKYFNNVNHAVQIVFANIAFDICKKFGGDYENVYNTIVKRDCFNSAYLDCNENLRGFGGHCLPKDTSAWANLIKELNLNYTMIDAVLEDNTGLTK